MRHIESEVQRHCIKWFRYQYPRLTIFAIPNGGARGRVEAAIMKGEGVLAGVADLFLLAPSKGCHGLFIEMKTGTGRQSQSQKEFQAAVEAQGYRYVLCRSLEDFIEQVQDYIG